MMQSSIAYVRLIRHVATLEHSDLEPREAKVLRDAADARLFGDDNAELWTADADVLLCLLEESGRLTPDECARVQRRLVRIQPDPAALGLAA
jgi:hypothetical protein